jgi:hypothetical protein
VIGDIVSRKRVDVGCAVLREERHELTFDERDGCGESCINLLESSRVGIAKDLCRVDNSTCYGYGQVRHGVYIGGAGNSGKRV